MAVYSNAEPIDLEPESIDLTIKIRPIIYPVTIPDARWPNKPSPTWHCTFEIKIGKDNAWEFPFVAYGDHHGEREGEHWEQTKKLWQTQYDYIRQHIAFTMLTTGQLLGREAATQCYGAGVHEFDWVAISKQVRAAARAVVDEYRERYYEAQKQQDFDTCRTMDAVRIALECVSYQISLVFSRLYGKPVINLGHSKALLRYTATRLERLKRIIDEFQAMWNAIAEMINFKRRRVRSNTQPFSDEEWESVKEQIKQAYNKPPDKERFRLGGIPDHLLDELRPLPWEQKFAPYRLAYVHAAIECGIHLPGPTWPEAGNWRIISDLIHASEGEPCDEMGE